MINSLQKSVIAVALLAGAVIAEAQQLKKMARIGYLSWQSGPAATLVTFKESLRELGWVEDKQIEIEYRYAGNDLDKLSAFAAELVHLKLDVIVAAGSNMAAIAAKRATPTIPIVMVGVVDPVTNGIVASLARPGGNVTGTTFDVTREQAGKNLELLKAAVPKISRVAILRNPNASTHMAYSKEAEKAAKVLGVAIRFAEVQTFNNRYLEDALAAVANQRADTLLVTPHPFFHEDRRHLIINFAARNKLPAIYPLEIFVNDGGLMSYGANRENMWRRAATYVDKILKGTKPSELPVEQPMKFDFVINLKTAKQIGLEIPQWTLMKADRVIR